MERLAWQEQPYKKLYTYKTVLKSFLILSLLMGNPNWYSSVYKNKQYETEVIDNKTTNKKIIEESIKKTISELKSLEQLPLRIQYPTKQLKDAPDILDINPKKISAPIDGISITLGKRTFYIEPMFGQITAIRLEEREEYQNNKKNTYKVLLLETTYLDKEYSEQKLSKLCSKLLNTVEWEWIKEWFPWSRVKELKNRFI